VLNALFKIIKRIKYSRNKELYPKWHEHYHMFLYFSIIASLTGCDFFYGLGLAFLIDEAFVQIPNEFAFGLPWFWKSTIYGIFLILIWISIEFLNFL
jgi:hypothetical protein